MTNIDDYNIRCLLCNRYMISMPYEGVTYNKPDYYITCSSCEHQDIYFHNNKIIIYTLSSFTYSKYSLYSGKGTNLRSINYDTMYDMITYDHLLQLDKFFPLDINLPLEEQINSTIEKILQLSVLK